MLSSKSSSDLTTFSNSEFTMKCGPRGAVSYKERKWKLVLVPRTLRSTLPQGNRYLEKRQTLKTFWSLSPCGSCGRICIWYQILNFLKWTVKACLIHKKLALSGTSYFNGVLFCAWESTATETCTVRKEEIVMYLMAGDLGFSPVLKVMAVSVSACCLTPLSSLRCHNIYPEYSVLLGPFYF